MIPTFQGVFNPAIGVKKVTDAAIKTPGTVNLLRVPRILVRYNLYEPGIFLIQTGIIQITIRLQIQAHLFQTRLSLKPEAAWLTFHHIVILNRDETIAIHTKASAKVKV